MMTWPVDPGQPAQPRPAAATPAAKRRRWPAYVVLGALVLVVVGAVTFSPHRTDPADRPENVAREKCQGHVKARLKAPATAKFTDGTVNVSGDTYTVTAAVDSQNGFGAMLRSYYTCQIVSLPSGAWQLVDVTILGS